MENEFQANDFLARHGLEKDPFSEEMDQTVYYENPDLLQRLDMVQHLLGYTNQMVFVIGEQGAGKTAMLNRIIYHAPEHWRICHIEAHPMLNTPMLLKQLASGFELEVHAGSEDMVEVYSEAIQTHVSSLTRSMQSPIVLIDNAHELPIDALILLFGNVQQSDDQGSLKIAMFCEPEITTMLGAQQLRPFAENVTHHIDIPEFTEQQTTDYLTKRLRAAGLFGELPFTKDHLHRLYKDSAGNPKEINTLAYQALLDDSLESPPVVDEVYTMNKSNSEDKENQQTEKPALPVIGNFQSWQIGVVALILIILTAIVWLTGQMDDSHTPSIAEELPVPPRSAMEEESLFEEPAIAEIVEEQIMTPETPEIETAIDEAQGSSHELGQETGKKADNTPETSQDNTAAPDPIAEFVESLNNESLTATAITETVETSEPAIDNPIKTTEVEKQEAVELLVQEPTIKTAQENTLSESGSKVKEETLTEQVKPVAEAIIEPAAAIENPVEKIIEQAALVEQTKPVPAPAVTAAPTAPPVEKRLPSIGGIHDPSWIETQPDNHFMLQLFGAYDKAAVTKFLKENNLGKDVAWFETRHGGKPWFVVVRGVFQNRSGATGSIRSLPNTIKNRKPWPRSIKNIKESMVP